jgi:nucleoid-associated protein YgaU
MPNGDPPMPADLQAIVNQALTDPNGNPFALQMAANACDLAGFHKTAADLRTRANVLTPPPQQAPAPGAAPQPQQLSIPGLGPIAIPPGFTLPPGLLPQQPNQNPAVTPLAAPTYVIRSGDSASAIALKFTGDSTRWRELLTSNPTLKADTEDVNGTPTTLVKPFNPGQILILPPSWPALPKS